MAAGSFFVQARCHRCRLHFGIQALQCLITTLQKQIWQDRSSAPDCLLTFQCFIFVLKSPAQNASHEICKESDADKDPCTLWGSTRCRSYKPTYLQWLLNWQPMRFMFRCKGLVAVEALFMIHSAANHIIAAWRTLQCSTSDRQPQSLRSPLNISAERDTSSPEGMGRFCVKTRVFAAHARCLQRTSPSSTQPPPHCWARVLSSVRHSLAGHLAWWNA